MKLAKPVKFIDCKICESGNNKFFYKHTIISERKEWQSLIDRIQEELEFKTHQLKLLKEAGCYVECIINSDEFVVNERADELEANLKKTAD